jgi:predicted nucleic acid-binding protein
LAVYVGLGKELTVCDAIYISLAKIHETTLVTADRKLVEIAGKTDFEKYVIGLAGYLR